MMADTDVPGPVQASPSRGVPLDRQTILDATERVLIETGYDGCTIRQIAGEIGCAVGSIYRYFPDKQTLLEAVTQRRFEAAADLAERGDSLEEAVAAYARSVAEDPPSYRLMFWLASMRPDAAGAQALPRVIRRIIFGWGRLLRDEDRGQRLWSLVHGAVMLGRDPQRAFHDAMAPLPKTETSPSPRAAIRVTRPLAVPR